MIDTQLRFKRAASVKQAPGSEPSHIHVVRPSRSRHFEATDLTDQSLPELTAVPTSDQGEAAA